jgi:Fe-Mn family superoxide dismutase
MSYRRTYPFTPEPLPYEMDALEPYISKKALSIHHDRLLAGYVDNLNNLLAEHPELQQMTLEELIRISYRLPPKTGGPLSRYAGGVYNHMLYFNGMAPESSGTQPQGELAQAIDTYFGSADKFRSKFFNSAMAVFGSGYTWLTSCKNGLRILNLPNQENPLAAGLFPVMCIDVWEHAYFLTYYNKRNEYIGDWWRLINWDYIGQHYRHFVSRSNRNK